MNSSPLKNTPSHLKIAFIKQGSFSHINKQVFAQLQRVFPEHEIEALDLLPVLNPLTATAAINRLHILRHYWKELLAGRNSFERRFYNTPYAFFLMRGVVENHFRNRAHEFAFSIQTQSLFDAHIAGVPHFVYTDHTHLANLSYPDFDHKLLAARAWIKLESEIYNRANGVFTMSSHVRNSLIELYNLPADKIHRIYAGSNTGIKPLPLENDNYGNKTVIYVGIDWERKGGPILLKAFERVLKAVPDAKLLIIGCKPPVNMPQVRSLGRVPPEQVRQFLARSSVFCFPTRLEPFGIAPLEAYMQRIPVIASKIGAMPDVVEDGVSGILVEPNHVEGFANSMIQLLTNPERCRQFGQRGHELVSKKYTWEHVGDRIRQHISAALGGFPQDNHQNR